VLITSAWGRPALPYMVCGLLWLATISGVYLALWFARQVYFLGWRIILLLLDGLAVVPILALFHVLELHALNPRISPGMALLVAARTVLFAFLWLLVMTLVHRRRLAHSGSVAAILQAGLTGFLMLPALHFIFLTPVGYKYISTAGNLFAASIVLQAVTWLAAWLVVLAAVRVRKWLLKEKRLAYEMDAGCRYPG
jgi:hypothetical protein